MPRLAPCRRRDPHFKQGAGMSRKRIVITGAAGAIGQRMLEPLRQRYDVVLLDVTDRTRDGNSVPGLEVCDLTTADRDAYRAHFRSADAAVHLAFVRAPGM
ncbi:MAG: NAD-dependent epimerase/dehydratase family protein, partial [Gammaproteobacteria bacterium]|nr:NAD-dependent epimerase/dehydratase family protein [Gammaproteobacteria bacterium]NIV21189.1 NAD-dependent epimerase/dehydratase family protein [Gammaproteobacteria bacterium]